MYNIKKELDGIGMSIKDYSSFLGVSEKTAHNKLYGKTAFTYPEAEKTQKILFPHYNIQYLFSETTNRPA